MFKDYMMDFKGKEEEELYQAPRKEVQENDERNALCFQLAKHVLDNALQTTNDSIDDFFLEEKCTKESSVRIHIKWQKDDFYMEECEEIENNGYRENDYRCFGTKVLE